MDTWSLISPTILFVIGLVIFLFVLLKRNYLGIIASLIPFVLLIFTYVYKVNSYQVSDKYLIINRPISFFNKKINLNEISSAKVLEVNGFKGIVRTFGNGGLFGYSGSYHSSSLGDFKMYATHQKNLVLIVLKGDEGKIVLSPDDTNLVNAVCAKIKNYEDR